MQLPVQLVVTLTDVDPKVFARHLGSVYFEIDLYPSCS